MRDIRLKPLPTIALLAGGVLLGSTSGMASAGQVDLTQGSLDTGSAAVTAVCNASPLTVGSVRSSFVAPATYEIRTVMVSAISNACRGKPYTLTVARNAGGFEQLTQWSGTLPAAASGSLTSTGSGAAIDDVPETNVVRAYVVVRTS